ncbi:kazrin-like isoform X2 [Mizuhopecten yessoensis]|uniref:kazrin-like isoform X2 n=1 Tax=Mizuhopecten yessoensis TaxID=6573 RepID=UPI000B45C48B|nr:kazrin-like isoform X2 [Mizuhopecten yessoensis]
MNLSLFILKRRDKLDDTGLDIGYGTIQSLDSLNDQIVQYIFTPSNGQPFDFDKDLLPNEQETLKSSMVLIRRLLHDAQSKFRKMVEDNKQLAARIDGSIHAANQEVNALRTELVDTNKRLSEIGTGIEKRDCGVQCDSENTPRHKADEENELKQLREENSRLEARLATLEQDDLKDIATETTKIGEMKLDLIQTKQELNRAKEALQAMKGDRKRLKAEKLELLNQMRQLYTTLEDKETELRDFIRNYETRMRESDDTIKQLATEREDCEHERWDLMKQVRDGQERTFILRSQLESKDAQIKKLEVDLVEAKEQQVSGQKHRSSMNHSPNSVGGTTTNSEELPPYETPPPTANFNSKNSSMEVLPVTPNNKTRERSNSLTPLLDSSDFSPSSQDVTESPVDSKKKKRISLNSISRVFSRGRVRRSIALPTDADLDDIPPNSRLTLLNPDNYQEKLQIVEQSKGCHMTLWKANQVLAWLEIVLNMPMYGKMCTANIKSGKVLLGLSDSELGSALAISNPMHRKKIRIAIEEARNPADIAFPKSCLLDHTWVAHRWMADLGLPQYIQSLETNLIDGRMLNILTKKEMEKYLGVHRKFHQASIQHGVELLRRLNFDKEMLTDRRSKCDSTDTDPLVWNNQRVIKWVQSIDLEEYAQNLKESGVHGALMVLEPQFTSDTLATALGIPPSKSYIRRHLKTELESLVKPARNSINVVNGNNNKTMTRNSTLTRSFRSSSVTETTGPKTKLSFRGSLGRAFGRKVREDMKSFSFEETTPRRKISAPMNFQHNSLQSVFEVEKVKTNS